MNKTLFSFISFLLIAFSNVTVAAKNDDGSHVQPDNYYPRVKFETTMGDIIVELDTNIINKRTR